ncbi:hypothetical protein IE53DRAFT_386349 [Violaceomyces palustris]|uniref:Uncharacterized protein n=1 Tax=Violaceomyces palustris TaxID=1673888 RepID=A0ACD0NZM3_9BASI|nr:hypothetical protein IE53DRAFT_386349 [Violaceomyces palustris]
MVLNGAAPHLDEGDEIEMENYLVEIKTFRRVTRVDVTEIVSPLGKSGKGKTLNPLPLGADPRDGRGRYESAEQPLRRKRRDPIERPHTFVTPFKSRVASDPISESPPRLGGPVAEYASPTDPGGKPRKRRLGCSPRAELGLPSKRSHRPREDE